MAMNLSKWLPTRDFGSKTWQKFWNSVPNNANDIRNVEIYKETEDLSWVYLGDGKPDIKKILSGITVDNYTFPIKYNQNLMRKTIQGSYRRTNKVQIWIGTADNRVTEKSGFFKVVYDPATDKHNLSAHADNANVLWNLGFDEGVAQTQWRRWSRDLVSPMAINYK